MIPFSVLDLSPVAQGSTPAEALWNSLDLARHAELLGYHRYWLAEHHGMPGIASAATAVVIGHVAAGTKTIRVGSGGIMLPNHSPLVIAEQFGTLASLYPGRIDLGLGRAPGSDLATARALRRNPLTDADTFPADVRELQAFLGPAQPGAAVQAVPGAGTGVPLWLLGSSLYSAQLAAILGLPFAFASHFAPAALLRALELYRHHFQPSAQLAKPYVMIAANVFAAETDAEARRQFSSVQQAFANLRRGAPGPVPTPVDDIDALLSPAERAQVDEALAYSAVGTAERVAEDLGLILAETRPDELLIAGHFHDHMARRRSFEIVAQVRDGMK
ncbi:luciferase family oxidoreductase, group 1 [Verrucomicrobium sp. GAS474]|uniref:LLM class flavin-dependent oxidoreductase n=1 Tax=Verrucomicrobium sp. GAS474 TaxID=1882831 RepID=UPI000879E64B|nr:LLM class flavin-dependent oxidoreductase [Verrucomicrobium sp. GAS474]SDT93862.1 luciferase family oxidoreductase, group 1 [Verrucomicrobium sp. GAS474]